MIRQGADIPTLEEVAEQLSRRAKREDLPMTFWKIVAHCLRPDQKSRPTATQILDTFCGSKASYFGPSREAARALEAETLSKMDGATVVPFDKTNTGSLVAFVPGTTVNPTLGWKQIKPDALRTKARRSRFIDANIALIMRGIRPKLKRPLGEEWLQLSLTICQIIFQLCFGRPEGQASEREILDATRIVCKTCVGSVGVSPAKKIEGDACIREMRLLVELRGRIFCNPDLDGQICWAKEAIEAANCFGVASGRAADAMLRLVIEFPERIGGKTVKEQKEVLQQVIRAEASDGSPADSPKHGDGHSKDDHGPGEAAALDSDSFEQRRPGSRQDSGDETHLHKREDGDKEAD